MRLRYVLLLTTLLGTVASLLLGFEFYQKLIEAERNLPPGQPPAPDSILNLGGAYTLALFALGLIFLAILLMISATLGDREWIARLENQPPAPEPNPEKPPEIGPAAAASLSAPALAQPLSEVQAPPAQAPVPAEPGATGTTGTTGT